MTKRVVITGIGIISSIGNTSDEVLHSLKNAKSGIIFSKEYETLGFRSQVCGNIDRELEKRVDRKARRFMGDGVSYNYLAMQQAIEDASLTEKEVSHPRTGLIMGSGGPSTENVVAMADILRSRGIRKVGPYMVTRTMCSSNSACLATAFKIRGVSYSITSACATSSHCIANGCELIKNGQQDIVFAGGGESLHWSLTLPFDAMGALSSKYNDEKVASTASRPYDVTRDGFVISGGGGVLVLESLDRAKRRGATIYAEVVGYGATSDGFNMVRPSGEGAIRCMKNAIEKVDTKIDYINTHSTGTPIGDTQEINSIREVFKNNIPPLSSTKALTGHALGAAGVHEAIFCLLMMKHQFLCKSAHITEIDPNFSDMPIVRDRVDNIPLHTIMSNSFGFGGTNASLVLRTYSS